MIGSLSSFQRLALDLLVNGPSSFGALYGFVAKEVDPDRPHVLEGFGAMVELASHGLVTMEWDVGGGVVRRGVDDIALRRLRDAYAEWLGAIPPGDLTGDDVSLDVVALWFSITESGRAAWSTAFAVEAAEGAWTLDDDCAGQALIIRAVDLRVAERALETWISLNPSLDPVPSSRGVTAESFRTNDGTVHQGIKLTLRYRKSAPAT